jgi:hypothetical protein
MKFDLSNIKHKAYVNVLLDSNDKPVEVGIHSSHARGLTTMGDDRWVCVHQTEDYSTYGEAFELAKNWLESHDRWSKLSRN